MTKQGSNRLKIFRIIVEVAGPAKMPGSVWRHVDADITLDGLDHLLGDGSLILPLTLLGDEQVSIHVGIEQRQLTPVPAQPLSDMLWDFGDEIFTP